VLNTYTQEWVIKAKITKKYPMRTWNNAKGSGTLLNMDLVDRS
jgi:replication factor A1